MYIVDIANKLGIWEKNFKWDIRAMCGQIDQSVRKEQHKKLKIYF